MRKSFKYRLYPTKAQTGILDRILYGARRLYNAALEQRRTVWIQRKVSVGYFKQCSELKEARENDPDLLLLNYSAGQAVLRRLQKAFYGFFRRIKSGAKPGYPRFKSADRFDSVIFPKHGDGVKLDGRHLYVQNVGQIKIKLHRPVQGVIKTVTLKQEGRHWYVVFSCDGVLARDFTAATGEVGIDVGLESFATLSTGEKIENPRWYRASEKKLKITQKALSSKKRGSSRYYKMRKAAARIHAKAKNQRHDFQHKLALRLVAENALIAVEDIRPKGMLERSSRGLSKSIQDASWSAFLGILSGKAEEAGRTLVKVPPQGTSSTCFRCGQYRKKDLSERVHSCTCGLVLDRDLHASFNILRLGRSLRSPANAVPSRSYRL